MRKCLIAAAAAGTLVIAVGECPAAQAGTGGEQPPSGVVSSVPASNTPHLKADESTTQQVRQLVQCGNTMYAVGTFDTIVKGSTIYSRNNIFSFSASAPYMASLNPATGLSDGFLHLNISGSYQYPGVASNVTHVFNQQLSAAARWTW